MSSQHSVIIGAGIVGLTTARALRLRGHNVTVIDRNPQVALGCSYSNAGLLTLGHTQAWANPGAPLMIIRALLGRHPSIKISKFFDPSLWRWGLEFLSQATPKRARENSEKLFKLAEHSLGLMQNDQDFTFPKTGVFYIFGDEDAMKDVKNEAVGNFAIPPHEAKALDPALPIDPDQQKWLIHAKRDFSTNCYKHCQALYELLVKDGVKFLFEKEASSIKIEAGKASAIDCGDERFECDTLVLASGLNTKTLAKPLGLNLLIHPVKGYASSWKIKDPNAVPRHPMIDEVRLVGVSVLDDILRVTTVAEFADANDRSIRDEMKTRLRNYVQDNFAEAVDLETPEFWTGQRPMTPYTSPYIGQVEHTPNIWINAGHGQLGWTLSYGSADVLARAISGEHSDIAHISANANGLNAL